MSAGAPDQSSGGLTRSPWQVYGLREDVLPECLAADRHRPRRDRRALARLPAAGHGQGRRQRQDEPPHTGLVAATGQAYAAAAGGRGPSESGPGLKSPSPLSCRRLILEPARSVGRHDVLNGPSKTEHGPRTATDTPSTSAAVSCVSCSACSPRRPGVSCPAVPRAGRGGGARRSHGAVRPSDQTLDAERSVVPASGTTLAPLATTSTAAGATSPRLWIDPRNTWTFPPRPPARPAGRRGQRRAACSVRGSADGRPRGAGLNRTRADSCPDRRRKWPIAGQLAVSLAGGNCRT